MEFKAWMLVKGFVFTPWLLYLAALALTVSAIWEKGKRARVMVAMTLLFLATAILITLVLPFNFEMIYNTGGF